MKDFSKLYTSIDPAFAFNASQDRRWVTSGIQWLNEVETTLQKDEEIAALKEKVRKLEEVQDEYRSQSDARKQREIEHFKAMQAKSVEVNNLRDQLSGVVWESQALGIANSQKGRQLLKLREQLNDSRALANSRLIARDTAKRRLNESEERVRSLEEELKRQEQRHKDARAADAAELTFLRSANVAPDTGKAGAYPCQICPEDKISVFSRPGNTAGIQAWSRGAYTYLTLSPKDARSMAGNLLACANQDASR